MFEYRKETKTVRQFILNHGDIDCNPVHQRLDREPKLIGGTDPSKAQSIIDSMLRGMDIGQITIHETPNGRFMYESIDGGHRKRYIVAFFNNKFPIHGTATYYRDMKEQDKDRFLNRELSFTIYQNLQPREVGEIFRALNETTPVNHQEMLNSYGDTPIANAVRETVRTVPQIENSHHALFEPRSSESKQQYVWVAFDNKGLRIDEMVARLYFRYWEGGGLGTSCDHDLEKMYRATIDEPTAQKLRKSVKINLDFVRRMVAIRKNHMESLLPQKEFVLFSRLWLYLEARYGSFSIKNDREFFEAVYKAYGPFKMPYDAQPEELCEISPLDSGKTVGKQFNDSLGEFRPAKSVEFPIECLLKNIDILSVITPRDTQRIFPREWREAKLIEQNFLCGVTGEPITMENSQGAHSIAWSEGGRTDDYANLIMISTKHNSRMGSMSVKQYKELLDLNA